MVILSILSALWLFLFLLQIGKIYKKNSKPYLSSFLSYSLSEIPCERTPSELSLLMDRKIGMKTFVSTFFYLIEKNIIVVKKEENDIVFSYHISEKTKAITMQEQYFLSIFFGGIGSKEEVRLSQMNLFCKTYLHRTDLLMEYTIWKRIAYENIHENFFEAKVGKTSTHILFFGGIFLLLMNFLFHIHSIFIYALLFPILFLPFYFRYTYKRTESANTEYFKWTAYKRYILDHQSYITNIPYSYIVNLIGLSALSHYIEDKNLYMIEIEKTLMKMIRSAILHGGRSV